MPESTKKKKDVRSQYFIKKGKDSFFSPLNNRIKMVHIDTNSFTQASK